MRENRLMIGLARDPRSTEHVSNVILVVTGILEGLHLHKVYNMIDQLEPGRSPKGSFIGRKMRPRLFQKNLGW